MKDKRHFLNSDKYPDLLTDAELMEIFRVSLSCLYKWRRSGVLPFMKLGKAIYYQKHHLIGLMEHRTALSQSVAEDADLKMGKETP